MGERLLKQELLAQFGWASETTTVELLQAGENVSFDVHAGEGRYVVRQYVSKRYTKEQVMAEVAWMNALRVYVDVPEVVANRAGEFVSEVDGIFYVAFRFLVGESPTEEVAVTPAHYRRLGVLVRDFRQAVGQVMDAMPSDCDWIGQERPHFTKAALIEEPRQTLLEFDALGDEDRTMVEQLAERLGALYDEMLATKPVTYVHADLHFGNVLEGVEGRWTLLDFDESGFGVEAFDLGTVKMHARFEKGCEPEELWDAFCEGYGEGISQAEVTVGAALRLFYMAGKIPKRMYIEELRKEPEVRLRRYFAKVVELLDEVGE